MLESSHPVGCEMLESSHPVGCGMLESSYPVSCGMLESSHRLMEVGGERENNGKEEPNPRRRMKTPTQIETLERVYAEDRYPSESVRAGLSLHLNLSDKQLQMWFCHRRLKDKKGINDGILAERKKMSSHKLGTALTGLPEVVLEHHEDLGPRARAVFGDVELLERSGPLRGSTSRSGESGGDNETDIINGKLNHVGFGGVSSPGVALGNFSSSSAVSQLGESFCQIGPVRGVEFDPLPANGFESLKDRNADEKVIITSGQQLFGNEGEAHSDPKTSFLQGEQILLPSAGTTKMKVAELSGHCFKSLHLPTAPRELKIRPEHPVVREESNSKKQGDVDRMCRRRDEVGPVCGWSFFHQNGYSLSNMKVHSLADHSSQLGQGHDVDVSLSLRSDTGNVSDNFPHQIDFDNMERMNFYNAFQADGQGASVEISLPLRQLGQTASSEEHIHAQTEKKRKSKEMKVAKESEASVKRIRRDLERQEIVRRKKEEQIKRELDKLDRERQKEEERANRERQREEERVLREQRRVIERQEKLLLKESKRMEKQHQKEALRRAKEAARLKAASEKAAAKKSSKDSMDTIEDEQLEVLEAAKADASVPIKNLQTYDRELLGRLKVRTVKFPPATVRMKVPLSIQPWHQLEHAVGHLFMVWGFLTTFSDVLGLWSFTVDELVQALHDFDPRLLGEIHMSLIKMLVKNVEDSADAAANAAATGQSSVSFTSGGHSQIVEAAYEWGFNVQEWGQHLSPLTWPEILRQFAIAAGYGPKWKDCKSETTDPADDCEDIDAVKTLRSGVAAARAAALVQGKGSGHAKKWRYRLTPGTVKYAAFHVLSLEGSKGLTILEVAEKIQKSGLRDLTTSKTPEASIAAALSRDTNLFERVAPSTYSVRSAFRKNEEDAQIVLQLAKERMRLFQSGFLDEEKETDEADDVDRDGDFDSDGQDSEDGDIDAFLVKDCGIKDRFSAGDTLNKDIAGEFMVMDESQPGHTWVQGLIEGEYSELSVEERLMALVALVNVVNEGHCVRQALEARLEAASVLKRQVWAEVQIDRRRQREEQLSRLQPFNLCVRNDGDDSQETQDIGSTPVLISEKASGSYFKVESESSLGQNLVSSASKVMLESISTNGINFPIPEKSSTRLEEFIHQDSSVAIGTGKIQGQTAEKCTTKMSDNIGCFAEELYATRSRPLGLDRRWNRYWRFATCSSGHDPGSGRIYFESSLDGHWEVIDSEEALDALMMSLDVRGTREAGLHAALAKLESSLRFSMRNITQNACCLWNPSPDLDKIATELNSARENDLLFEETVDEELRNGLRQELLSSPGAISRERRITNIQVYRSYERLKHCQQWLWSEQDPVLPWRLIKYGRRRECDLISVCCKCQNLYWVSDKHCLSCHVSKAKMKQDLHGRCPEEKPDRLLTWKCREPFTAGPPHVRILGADIASLEVIVPSEALTDSWDLQRRKTWVLSVMNATTPIELLGSYVEIVRRIKRGLLSSDSTRSEAMSTRQYYSSTGGNCFAPWMPQTSAAIGLNVIAFCADLALKSDQKKRKRNADEDGLAHRTFGPCASRGPGFWIEETQSKDQIGSILGRNREAHGRGRNRGGLKSRAYEGNNASITKHLAVKKFNLETVAGPTRARTFDMSAEGEVGIGRGSSQGRLRGRQGRGGGHSLEVQSQPHAHKLRSKMSGNVRRTGILENSALHKFPDRSFPLEKEHGLEAEAEEKWVSQDFREIDTGSKLGPC